MRRLESPRDMPWARHRLIESIRDTEGAGMRALAAGLLGAQCYWVTPDMTRLAMDAALDLPEWTPETVEPTPEGLLVWAGTLPPIHVVSDLGEDQAIRPAGIAWHHAGGRLQVSVLARDAELRRAVSPLELGDLPPLCPLVGIIHTRQPGDIDDDFPERNGLTALVGATWIMMQQPGLTARRDIRPASADVDRAAYLDASHPTVTSVSLRPLRHATQERDPDHEPTRHLTVRHLVRGHWRQQYYSSDGSHRPRYIEPYIKGPENAPLVHSEKVLVWRR